MRWYKSKGILGVMRELLLNRPRCKQVSYSRWKRCMDENCNDCWVTGQRQTRERAMPTCTLPRAHAKMQGTGFQCEAFVGPPCDPLLAADGTAKCFDELFAFTMSTNPPAEIGVANYKKSCRYVRIQLPSGSNVVPYSSVQPAKVRC